MFVHCRLQSKRSVCSFVSKLDCDVLVVTVLYTRLYFVKSYQACFLFLSHISVACVCGLLYTCFELGLCFDCILFTL